MSSRLSLTYVDDSGRTTTRQYGMETQATLAEYIAAADALIAAIEDISDMGLRKGEITITVPGASFAVTENANKDVGATVSGWVYDGDGKKASHKWPHPKAATVGADGSIAVTGLVATYLALFENGGDFNLSDGEQIDAWIKATLDG